MTYQLYGEDGSGSGIVEMALARIGAPYELHQVSLGSEQQLGPSYAKLNPQRKLPTLVTPAGEVLTESAAIVLVLDERHPEAALFPARGTSERAQALRWLLFLAAELYPLIEIIDYPDRFAPEPVAAPALREVARRLWRERWLLMEAAIAGAPWLLASGFCCTDVYLAMLCHWTRPDAWRAAHLPRAEAIAAALARDERIGPVWRRHHEGKTSSSAST
jgi:glutathione S-transferase